MSEDGLFSNLSPLQKAEVVRMRDSIGVHQRALQLVCEEVARYESDDPEGPVEHAVVEAKLAGALVRAALLVGGAVPEPERVVVGVDVATGVIVMPNEGGDAWVAVPPQGERRGWLP